jgi:uncharacterized membrane protein
MAATLRFVHLLALVVWIGGVVFFSFFTAPALFSVLPRDMAGRVTVALFPRYYLMGAVCGVIALLTALLQWLRAPARARRLPVEMILLILMLAMTLYAGLGILPETSSLRPQIRAADGSPGREAAQRRFDILHRRSVVLNGLVLLCGIGALATLARRDRPQILPERD